MKYLIVAIFAVVKMVSGQAQSESHDFITYDSAIYYKVNAYDSARFSFRISRPRYSDGPRAAIIMTGGKGEQGTGNYSSYNPAGLQRFGPHFWLNNGWDGGVQLGNGKHYPILITMQSRDPNVTILWEGFKLTVLSLIKIYNINPKAVHLTGLSYGSWVSSGLAAYMAPGVITSIAPLSGAQASMGTYAPLGHWAKLGGKGFFTVGYQDYGNDIEPPKAVKAMQDSVKGSVYFTYNSVDNGLHGDWNTIYNPANNMWLNKLVTTLVYPGTYFNGENIYQWELRQGDTSLAAAPVVQPPLNIPPVAAFTYTIPAISPVTYVVLDGSKSYDTDGTIDSTWITQVSGPNQAFLVTSVCDVKGVAAGLIPGTYVFQLKVKDNKGSTGSSLAQLVIPAPVKTVILTLPIPLTFLGVTINKTLIVYSDGTYIIQ